MLKCWTSTTDQLLGGFSNNHLQVPLSVRMMKAMAIKKDKKYYHRADSEESEESEVCGDWKGCNEFRDICCPRDAGVKEIQPQNIYVEAPSPYCAPYKSCSRIWWLKCFDPLALLEQHTLSNSFHSSHSPPS
jgi:hypothetical protein